MIGLVAASTTHVSVAHIESTLSAIETVLLFAVPIFSIISAAYIGLYYQIRQKLRDNNAQLRQIHQQTNGTLSRLADGIESVAASTARAPRRATDPEPPAGPPAG